MKKTKKRLKLPNGFGSIIFLSGSRRRPWAVKKSGKYLNYFTSYEDAIIFLADLWRDKISRILRQIDLDKFLYKNTV